MDNLPVEAMMFGIISIIDKDTSELIQIPWGGQWPQAPLVQLSEYQSLIGNTPDGNTLDEEDLYNDVATRLNFLQQKFDEGHTITLNHPDPDISLQFKKGETGNFPSFLSQAETAFNNVFFDLINTTSQQEGIFRLLTPEAEPAGRSFNSSYSKLLAEDKLAETDALSDLVGPADISLQLGYVHFGEEDLGPDSIVFGDLNEVRSAGSLRSDTDIAMKMGGGRAFLEIDIVFANTKAINDKLRSILGMIKLAPIIPVGGKAISAMLINQITAEDTFKALKETYTKIRRNTTAAEAFRKSKESLQEVSRFAVGELTSALQNEREALSVLKRWLEDEARQEDIQDQAERSLSGIKASDIAELTKDDNTIPVTLALAVDSVLVSTIASSPGALRMRMSLQKLSDAYLPPGGLSFVDKNGNPTFDIRKSVLKKAVDSLYLDPNRSEIKEDGTLTLEKNKFYIPKIGDGILTSSLNKADKENQRAFVDPEMGHTMYRPIGTDSTLHSPALFRFSTAKNPETVLEYVPHDLVLRAVSWNYKNKLAPIELQGNLYPTFQHMGMGTVNAQLNFDTTSDSAVKKLMTIKGAMDQQSTHKSITSLLRREFFDIYNDIINLTGYKRFLVSAVKIETDPDNPGLYHIALEVISNEENIRDREALQENLGPKGKKEDIKAFWWWLYAGLVIKFYQSVNRNGNRNNLLNLTGFNRTDIDADLTSQFRTFLEGGILSGDSQSPAGGVYGKSFDGSLFNDDGTSIFGAIGTGKNSSHTQAELDLIWDMVFGTIDGKNIKEGILERNLFRIALIEVLRSGKVLNEIKTDSIPDDFKSASDDNKYFGSYLPFLINNNLRGNNIRIAGQTVDGDVNNISNVLDAIIRRTTDTGDLNAGVSPWFIISPTIEQHQNNSASFGGYSEANIDLSSTRSVPLAEIYSRLIKEGFEDDVPRRAKDDPIYKIIKANAIRKRIPAWIPTPIMWDKVLRGIYGWYDLLADPPQTKYGLTAGYEITSEGNDRNHVFVVTDGLKDMRTILSTMVGDPVWQAKFPSFWKRFRGEPKDFITDINLYGSQDFKITKIPVDPSVYEFRNNYLDLRLPRYFELFSEEESISKGRPVPTKAAGTEVWRKVAPTYLELGQRPDIFKSITGAILRPKDSTGGASVSVKNPNLLTPRSFYDYVEPGFFYYKKSWLNERYNEILKKIETGTDPDKGTGEFNPLGDDPSGGFGLSATERTRLKRLGTNPDVVEPIKFDFAIEDIVKNRPAVQSNGVFTTGIEENIDHESIGSFLARRLGKTLSSGINTPTDKTSPIELTKLALLAEQKLKRIPVIDNTNRQLGSLVAVNKGYKGKNSQTVKIRHSYDLLNKERQALGGEGNTEVEFQFIYLDSADTAPKDPLSIGYRDSAGVLDYNIYDKNSAAAIYKSTIESATDMKANHVRAYPTFRLFFVRERIVGDNITHYLEDDIYGYNSVLGIDITVDKEDAATAVVVVTDITGVLSTNQFESQILDDKDDVNRDTEDGSDEAEETGFRSSIKLEPGTNIVIKMGYGHDPDSLETIFTGSIAELDPGPITTIVAQGYKTELFRHVNFYSETSFFSGLIDRYFLGRKISNINGIIPNYLVLRILSKLAEIPGVDTADSYSGLPHFGRFMSLGEYKTLTDTAKLEYTNVYQSKRDQGSLGLTPLQRFYSLASSASPGASVVNSLGFSSSGVANYLNKYSKHFIHTNAMRNVFFGEDASDSFFDSLTSEWIVNTDGWNALKEITRYKVGYICQVVPYGNRASLFIGRPDQLYHYKPVTHDVLNGYSKALPVVSSAIFATAYWSILSRFFESKEFGSISDPDEWNNFFFKKALFGDNRAELIANSRLDLNLQIDAYAKYIAETINRFIQTNPQTAVNLPEISDHFRDYKNFPSFNITRTLLARVKQLLGSELASPESDKKTNRVAASTIFSTNDIGEDSQLDYVGSREDGIIVVPQFSIPEGVTPREFSTRAATVFSNSSLSTQTRGILNSKSPIDIERLFSLGYEAGDYWAVTLGGKYLSREDLRTRFGIDPKTGTPANTNVGSNRSILLASDVAYAVGTDRYTSEAVFDGFITNTTTNFKTYDRQSNRVVIDAKNHSAPYVLLDDRSNELATINGYSKTALKLAFATYFGLAYTETKVTDPSSPYHGSTQTNSFIRLPDPVERVWEGYTRMIMRGLSNDYNLNQNGPEAVQEYTDKLVETLKPTIAGDYGTIKYGDIKSSGTKIDNTLLQDAATVFAARLRDMVIKGEIPEEEFPIVQRRFRQFIELARAGRIADSYVSNITDLTSTVDSVQRFVLSNKRLFSFLTTEERSLGLSRLSAEETKFISDKLGFAFDFSNPNHVAKFEEYLQEISAQLYEIDFDDQDASNSENLLNTIYDKLNSFESREESSVTPQNIPEELTSGIAKAQLSDEIYKVLINNADDYKLFLTFFAKWLAQEGSNLEESVAPQSLEALTKTLDSVYAPGVKRFSDVHYITSGHDIVENNIITTMSEMANNILLMTVKRIKVQDVNGENAGDAAIYSVNEEDTDYVPYPNYQTTGIDYHPFVRPELRKQRLVIERNAETDNQRAALLINHMAEAVRPMYRGHLKVIGRKIKPYDRVVLMDTNKDMFGMFEVERVVHNFHADTGWVTTIIPCALVHPVDAVADVVSKFDTSEIDTMLNVLDAAEWVLEGMFIIGLLMSVFTGGTSAVAAAGGQAGKEVGKSAASRLIAGVLRKGLQSAFRRQGKRYLSTVNKKLSTKLSKEELEKLAKSGTLNQLAERLALQQGARTANNMSLAFSASMASGLDFAVAGSSRFGLSLLGTGIARRGAQFWLNMATEMNMESATLPIHTFCLTRYGRPLQAGLDMEISRFYSFSERLGAAVDGITDQVSEFIDEAFRFEADDLSGGVNVFDIIQDYK